MVHSRIALALAGISGEASDVTCAQRTSTLRSQATAACAPMASPTTHHASSAAQSPPPAVPTLARQLETPRADASVPAVISGLATTAAPARRCTTPTSAAGHVLRDMAGTRYVLHCAVPSTATTTQTASAASGPTADALAGTAGPWATARSAR